MRKAPKIDSLGAIRGDQSPDFSDETLKIKAFKLYTSQEDA
jgi:hypothetical protein